MKISFAVAVSIILTFPFIHNFIISKLYQKLENLLTWGIDFLKSICYNLIGMASFLKDAEITGDVVNYETWNSRTAQRGQKHIV